MLLDFLEEQMTYKKRLQMPEAGGSTCQNDNQNSSLKIESGWVNIQEYRMQKTASPLLEGVGQHPRMVGQHKTEWWVNMVQNLQSFPNGAVSSIGLK
jgi:hypothetical protein